LARVPPFSILVANIISASFRFSCAFSLQTGLSQTDQHSPHSLWPPSQISRTVLLASLVLDRQYIFYQLTNLSLCRLPYSAPPTLPFFVSGVFLAGPLPLVTYKDDSSPLFFFSGVEKRVFDRCMHKTSVSLRPSSHPVFSGGSPPVTILVVFDFLFHVIRFKRLTAFPRFPSWRSYFAGPASVSYWFLKIPPHFTYTRTIRATFSPINNPSFFS